MSTLVKATPPQYPASAMVHRPHIKNLGFTLPSVVTRRLLGQGPTSLPLKIDLTLSAIRTASSFLSTRQQRSTHGSGDGAALKILARPRFAAVKENLYQKVSLDGMLGYWTFRGSFTSQIPPKEADVVLYFLHGGGYCVYQPGHFLTFQLFLADWLLTRGIKVAIFALDYGLAPEAAWPEQLMQAARGLRYLVKEIGVQEEKVAFMGDSAGANLCLSLLEHIRNPHPDLIPNPTTGIRKPRWGILISPWVTFRTDNPAYEGNSYLDYLVKSSLERCAEYFRGLTPAEDEVLRQYTEFVGEKEWVEMLPERTWVLSGGQELFLGDIKTFYAAANSKGANIEMEVGERLVHDPPIAECLTKAEGYLNLKVGEEIPKGILPVTTRVARAVERFVKMRGSRL
ncbi:Similar to Arylacetamide deacetylase; acc. no. Q99PG0 [Pyronema omphalodes CBS 100304]|uniref:Similar to Arylacetamide deacetylase acc. no. Q99PG0 n=1 Tax=Pyronema omphalodes (strain CBS 100304) TaxID=1076935 RepID=U4LBF6_PYROM|nr:Similar to Arylacetamide deacetylase; acc. no. Q99PG0 [Pyronema omphalodes CBS 100304]